MNRQQIIKIYDEFPEGKRDMPRSQFIKEVSNALDSNKMVRDVDAIIQRRRMGAAERVRIDAALREKR